MPASGSFTYKVGGVVVQPADNRKAFIIYHTNKNPRLDYLNVNFDNKTISGILTAGNSNVPISLSGTISGNQFSGDDGKTKMSGRFIDGYAEGLTDIFKRWHDNTNVEMAGMFFGKRLD